MASKVSIESVLDACRAAKVPADVVTTIMKTIQTYAEEEALAKEEKPPKAKLQTVMLINDPDGSLAKAGITSLGGWVIQMDRDAPVSAVVDRLKEGALVFNRSPKGRKSPVKSLGEAIHYMTAKHLLDEAHPERRTRVQTKDVTQLVVVNGSTL